MGILTQLKPERVFYYFEEITKIPHGSGNTEGISSYATDFAKNHGLEFTQDVSGNILIIKEASPGYEKSDTVMLQGHLDMVCEKNSDNDHDFKKDPLPIGIMDDYVYAKGTTLGGDDGIAIAYMFAILEDKSIEAPRLECLMTVDEEIGMLGATAFDASALKAKVLLNLDSEEEGIFLSSCAGGVRSNCTVAVRYKEKTGIKYHLVISGFKGGHSGTEIDKYHGNANIILGRMLHYLGQKVRYSIISMQGGLQDNAISREADAYILVHEEDVSDFEDMCDAFESMIRNEYKAVEDNIQIYCNNEGCETTAALTRKTQERIIFLLNTMPDGVQKMSMEIRGLVQTSLNLGIIRLDKEHFTATCALRSAVQSEKEALANKLRYLTETIGGTYNEMGNYPSWEYRSDSRIRPLIIKVYERLFEKKAVVEGIHAGLECGILSSKLPELDIVAFGPDILDIHTPKERMSISSVERVYRLILEVLKELK